MEKTNDGKFEKYITYDEQKLRETKQHSYLILRCRLPLAASLPFLLDLPDLPDKDEDEEALRFEPEELLDADDFFLDEPLAALLEPACALGLALCERLAGAAATGFCTGWHLGHCHSESSSASSLPAGCGRRMR
jgi:hypothetical protein